MSKFTSIEPDEEDLALFSKTWINAGEINLTIEQLESNIPDKRTKDYQNWLKKVNFLIDLYNKEVKFKAYKKYE